MKTKFFFLGFITGGITVFLALSLIGSIIRFNHKREINKISENLANIQENLSNIQEDLSNIQYVEVKAGDRYVTLHTKMHKDSVKILLGRPSKIDMHSYANDVGETWMYKYADDRYGHSLMIRFNNGKLESIQQF